MISFPKAKINLGLSIVSRRSDGYHNLESVFYPIALKDIIEIVPASETKLFITGLEIPGEWNENLVVRAYFLLKIDFPSISPVHIYLHKKIPFGAGLGGGSSDAAEALILLNRLFCLNLSFADLNKYALELGSDCPFFLQADPRYATGRGEILEPIPVDLSTHSFLLLHPAIRIGTAWAFERIKPSKPESDLREDIHEPIENWKHMIKNDFEIPVFKAYPDLQKLKDILYDKGALYSSLSGSGSTIYGIFLKNQIPKLEIDLVSCTIIP